MDQATGSEDFEDVYAFDEWTAGPLRSCAVAQPGEHLQAHVYMRDHYWEIAQRSQTRDDWIVTFATLLKVVEMHLLYYFGSRRVFLVTGAIWAYTFLSAIILQWFHVGRATTAGEQPTHFDVVSGSLPTPQVIGGERRVLFGIPVNLRKGRAWQVFWILGAVVCVTSLLGTYAILSNEPTICFRIWLGFQVIWLALRSIFFHFAQQVDDMKHIITPTITDENRPPESSLRLLGLAVGVSKHQILNHPRGVLSYANDAQDPVAIRKLLSDANLEYTKHFELPTRGNPGPELNITVVAVIGDTLLSSVAWLMGSPLTGMDLYDSCILAVRVSGTTQLIPSCRVLSGRITSEQVPDPETTLPSNFRPKGAANEGHNISWRYWIPCDEKKWLWYSTPWATTTKDDLGITGTKKMTVTTGDDITKELLSGTLQISMSDVQAVEDAIAQSAKAATILRNMLKEDFTTFEKSAKS
ncbi:hypothetical protein J4E91_010671 [Alternaria rosae]|nr:hypothetical protein J4E91_010671 [Alternaria rosae]